MKSIGYKQISEWLQTSEPMEELVEKICAATRQYAKRQCTWFKNIEADFTFEKPIKKVEDHPFFLESIQRKLKTDTP